MFIKYVGLAATAALLAGCWTKREVEVVSGGEPVATRVDIPTGNALPAGADIAVRIDQTLSTEDTEAGERITATVASTVMALNGDVVIPQGAKIYGEVKAIDDSDNPVDQALIQLDFDALEFQGKRFLFNAVITDVANVAERSKSTGQVLERAGTGAAAGAVIGAIISGGDLDAIVKGGVVGATAGTVVSLGLGDVEHVIPAGTQMMLRATETVVLR